MVYIIPLKNGCSFFLSEVLSDGSDSLETSALGKGNFILICTRFGWILTTTVINPSHDEKIHPLQGVLDSSLLMVYNGVTHYMAIGTY